MSLVFSNLKMSVPSESESRRKSEIFQEDPDNPHVIVTASKDKKKKKQMTYYISKEDIVFLTQKTHYSEQEIRYLLFWLRVEKLIKFGVLFREWHQNFREECPEGILDKEHIMKIYDEISPFGNSKDFVDHIFRIFDKDGDGSIDFKEFMIATDLTVAGTPEEKLRWAFKVRAKMSPKGINFKVICLEDVRQRWIGDHWT